MSAVVIIGAWRLSGLWASGTAVAADSSVGIHCWAPAGLRVSFHSYPKSVSK